MAKASQSSGRKFFDDDEFTPNSPTRNATVPIDDSGNIQVSINNHHSGTLSYQATLFVFPFADPADPVVISQEAPGGGSEDSVPLARVGATNVFSAPMFAGEPDETGAGNNLAIQIDDLSTGDSQRFAFRAQTGGSSGSGGILLVVRSKFCREDQPIPVALTLKLDSALAKGSCNNIKDLNKPMLVVHSDDPHHAGAWFSRPLNLGEKGSQPAYWVLKKTDAKTWILVLRQEKTTIVQFVLKTKVAKDCTFPIQLTRQGAGGKHFTKWPKTVTIAPAP
jgi:hypothetical protein